MATEPKSRRRRRKKVLRKTDGSLYDVTERRRITPAELRDYVREGGLFEARRQETGSDCTYEVLREVVGAGMLETLVPGLGGGPLSALGGLGGLGALGGGGGALGGLGQIARLLGDEGRRSGDGGWNDWDEGSRRSKRRGDDRGWGDDRQVSDRSRRGDDDDRGWDFDPDADQP
jgi:hypothetical protein